MLTINIILAVKYVLVDPSHIFYSARLMLIIIV